MAEFPIRVVAIGFILSLLLSYRPAYSQTPIVGMNAAIAGLSVDQQNTILGQLHAAGIRYIRSGITDDDKGVDFARRTMAQGIKILWLVQLQYRADAPSRPWPNAYGAWGGHPLSALDPDLFHTYFQSLMTKLEGAGITLAGFELGNEINSANFNPDFTLPAENPGHPREFVLTDLSHDPEAEQVAKGYLQYLKLLQVIKDVRSHSKLNQHTPIISAGLVYDEAPDAPKSKDVKLDSASAYATIDFMRANGLDNLVDAYGVHTYPWTDNPGNSKSEAGRTERLTKYVLAQCRPEGSAAGKPCWITEWGIPNHDTSCPVHETNQIPLINATRANFRSYVAKKEITALFYYAWIDSREGFGVYRCNQLTEAGRLALAPF